MGRRWDGGGVVWPPPLPTWTDGERDTSESDSLTTTSLPPPLLLRTRKQGLLAGQEDAIAAYPSGMSVPTDPEPVGSPLKRGVRERRGERGNMEEERGREKGNESDRKAPAAQGERERERGEEGEKERERG